MPIDRLAFSPNGRVVASTAFLDEAVILWELKTGRQLRMLSVQPGSGTASFLGGLAAIAFSPDSMLIAISRGSSISVWDVQTGNQVLSIPEVSGSFSDTTMRMEFSPDGRMLAAQQPFGLRLLDVATGEQIRTFSAETLDFAFTSDSRQLLLLTHSGAETQAVFKDINTGQESHGNNLSGRENALRGRSIARTPEGHFLVVTEEKENPKIWDVALGSKPELLSARIDPHAHFQTLSPDGRFGLFTVGADIAIWDLTAQREVRRANLVDIAGDSPQANFMLSAEFSFDGRLLALGGSDGRVKVWETSTGRGVVDLVSHANLSRFVAFESDGKQLLFGKTRWDLVSGRGHPILPNSKISSGYLSPGGNLLADSNRRESTILVWDIAARRLLETLSAQSGFAPDQIAFSPNGQLLAATYIRPETSNSATQAAGTHKPTRADLRSYFRGLQKGESLDSQLFQGQASADDLAHQVLIWDVASRRPIQTLPAEGRGANGGGVVRFSPDGRYLAFGSRMGQIKIWDVRTWAEAARFDRNSSNGVGGFSPLLDSLTVTAMSFSPDGHRLAAAFRQTSSNMSSVLGSMVSPNQPPQKVKKHKFGGIMGGLPGMDSASRAPRAGALPATALPLTFAVSGPLEIFDLETRQKVSALPGHDQGTDSVAFSADGKLLASAGRNGEIKLWDLASARETRTLTGTTSGVGALTFSPDGSLLASAALDGSASLWDVEDGEHLARLVSLNDGSDWLLMTPDGLFDGSPASWKEILWRFGGNTFDVAPVEMFFSEYYYPDLLADLIAGKRPRAMTKLEEKDRRQPQLSIERADTVSDGGGIRSRDLKLRVNVTSAPAGAQDVRLFRNGSLVKVWRGDVLRGQSSVSLETAIPVTAGDNKLYAYAFNHDNVKSTDATLDIVGAESLRRKGEAYILAIGINQYADPDYNLKFAVDDATVFGDVLRQYETDLKRFDHIAVVAIYDEEATKANILAALADLARKVQPEDVVFIFIASHGTASQGHFYLVPHDLGYAGSRTHLDADALKSILTHSISDRDLEKAFEGLDAGGLLLVLDACNSGQALEAEEKRQGPMNSKGLAQLAYEKGMYVLTASQSYQAAQEASELGHGLLTYALVEEGLRQGAADFDPKDGQIVAREWLDYASTRVPEIQMEKIQQFRGLRRSLSFSENPRGEISQQPRLFYRRELEDNAWVIARP